MLDLKALCNPTDPLAYFSLLVSSDAHFPLFEAAASIAQDEYEGLDVQAALAEMDQLQGRLAQRVAADAPALQRLLALNFFFYRELGFAANANDPCAAENSYVHTVLQTRRGTSVILAIIWLELAAGIGLRAVGVNFPGGFLLKVNLPGRHSGGHIVLDPLTAKSLTGQDLYERLHAVREHARVAGEMELPLGPYLQDAHPRTVLSRLLYELKMLYHQSLDWARVMHVCDRLVIVNPSDWAQYRDRGQANYRLGHYAACVSDLDSYLWHNPHAVDHECVQIMRTQALAHI